MVAIPASLSGVLLAALWSLRRGKDLDKDPAFQEKMKDPEFAKSIQSSSHSLLDEVFPASAKRSVVVFLTAIAVVVILGAFDVLRPSFPNADGEMKALSMNLVIQMVMLVAWRNHPHFLQRRQQEDRLHSCVQGWHDGSILRLRCCLDG